MIFGPFANARTGLDVSRSGHGVPRSIRRLAAAAAVGQALLAATALGAARAEPAAPAAAKAPGADAACGRTAICGLRNPEDVVPVEGTRWAIASQLAGGLMLVDLAARTATPVTPSVSQRAEGTCPGAPDPSAMITHGLDIRRIAPGRFELLVINHGSREAIERYEVTGTDGRVALRWVGCTPIPAEVRANAVTALPDGFAVSSFGTKDDPKMLALRAGRPSGFVMLWSRRLGWRRLPGSEFSGDNGLATSPDGRELYVNAWGEGVLYVLPLHSGGRRRSIPLGEVHPDNVHRLPDGDLLVAGQIGSADAILSCSSSPCPFESEAVVVDPARGKVTWRRRAPASPAFGAASVALRHKGAYWLASYQGDRLIEIAPPAR
jgi:hypothetical protein